MNPSFWILGGILKMGWRRMVLKDLELLFLSCFLFSDGKSQRHMSQERWIQPWVQVARNWNEAIIQPPVCLGKVEEGFGRIHCQKSTSPQLFPTLALKLQWNLSCHLPSSKMKKVPLLRFAGWVADANGGTSTTWCRGGATEPRTRRGKRTVETRHFFNNFWLIFFWFLFELEETMGKNWKLRYSDDFQGWKQQGRICKASSMRWIISYNMNVAELNDYKVLWLNVQNKPKSLKVCKICWKNPMWCWRSYVRL